MFGIGLPELIIIIVVALLVVGPSKLPELARSMGRALGEFRRMADDVKDTIEHEMSKPLDTDDEKMAGQEKQPGQEKYTEAPAEEKQAEAQEATDQAIDHAAAQATNQEAADAAASESQYAETAEPGPDETYLAEEEKRLLDQNKEQVAKGTEVDEQKRT
jgi:Tat protein translocase TatB subunit